jgi:hypothetical protein
VDDSTHQSNHLDTAFVELILKPGKRAQFRCTHRGEIGRVGEQDGPLVADELVEVNLTLGGQGREVGSYPKSVRCSLGNASDLETIPVEPRRRRGCSVWAENGRRKAGARGTCADHAARGAVLSARNI